MELSPDIAQLVVWELGFIRWLLIALVLMAGYFVYVFMAVNKALSGLGDLVRNQGAEKRKQTELEDLISRGLSREAKFSAQEWVAKEPKQPYAHWYLAKAHHQIGELVEAKAAFQATMDVAPNWTEAVTPWLRRIEEEIKNRGPKLVE